MVLELNEEINIEYIMVIDCNIVYYRQNNS